MGGGGVKHGGPYGYQQWWSTGDWRCGHGAGGGGCSRPASSTHHRAAILADWVATECGYKPKGATTPCADTPKDAMRAVANAKLRVVPIWPAYLPSRIRDGTWYVSDLRGVQRYPRYPDKTASGRTASESTTDTTSSHSSLAAADPRAPAGTHCSPISAHRGSTSPHDISDLAVAMSWSSVSAVPQPNGPSQDPAGTTSSPAGILAAPPNERSDG